MAMLRLLYCHLCF